MPTVTIKRGLGYVDSLWPYSVFLDGAYRGTTPGRQPQIYDVSPGDHTLQVEVAWFSTPKVSFPVADEPVTFQCFTNLGGVRRLLPGVALFNPGSVLGIARLEEPRLPAGKHLVPEIASLLEKVDLEAFKFEEHWAVLLKADGKVELVGCSVPLSRNGDTLALVPLRRIKRFRELQAASKDPSTVNQAALRATMKHLAAEIGDLLRDQRPDVTL